MYSICIIFAQSFYNIFTIFVQYFIQYSHNILYNIFTIDVQYLLSSCTIFEQYSYNIWVKFSPSQPFAQICACFLLMASLR